jgi:IS605 OrfB family transposase
MPQEKAPKQIVITRKVQVNFDVEKAQLKDCFAKIFSWQKIVHKAANWIITHQHLQENIKDLFYLTDNVKVKLANIDKDEDGILTTSKDNTTYRILSEAFKGECPMGMLSGLNTVICKKYKSDAFKVKTGQKSLASFSKNIPMPVRAADISSWKKGDDKDYTFFVYGVPFKTYFGKDLSRNEEIFDRALVAGDYKLCDSSLALEKHGNKWKLFLLTVFSFDKEKIKLSEKKVAHCRLSLNYPIIILEKKDKFYHIGTAEDYLHRRLAIKGALSRLQKACKYNNGGKGRDSKLQAIDRFKKTENNYINSRMHLYSRELINYCIKRGIGKIVLDNYKEVVEETHEGTEKSKFLLASWSYYNLADKIKYKAAKVGIIVEIEGKDDEEPAEVIAQTVDA